MPPFRLSFATSPLPPNAFLILVTLAEGHAHGYQIRKDLIVRSNGQVRLDPGSLYRLISRLLDDGLIAEAAGDAISSEADRRRRYRLTPQGRRVLQAETDRLADLVAQARATTRRRARQT